MSEIADQIWQLLERLNHLAADQPWPDDFSDKMRTVRDIGNDVERHDVAELARLLMALGPVGQALWEIDGTRDDARQLIDSIRTSLESLAQFCREGDIPNQTDNVKSLTDRWRDQLALLDDDIDDWNDEPDDEATDGSEPMPSSDELALILNSLGTPAVDAADADASANVRAQEPSFRAGEGFADTTADQPLVAPEPKPFVMDAETREAYADDAIRCLTGIEQAILSFEQNPSDHRTIQSICRELHTLKGASATVGLDEFATYFHQVEDSLASGRDVGVDVVLACVDAVREQLKLLVDEATLESDVPEVRSYNVEDTGDATPDSIRVKSSQLDRLLDLLAELVMLRNRRDSRVDSLRQVNDELVRCVTRLRTYGENVTSEMIANSGDQNNFARTAAGINSLTEVATDLLELGQNLRELYEPVAEENAALSRFIGQFRQELMELRRMPINGLFQRVQRTLREAARVERKQVRMEVRGQHLGLERSVQEQLFDPLLHIVRNAVSHGIELPKDRESVGKSPTGTLTLSASASSNLFVLEIRDDGRGLDYDALRRRGQERGLLPSNRPATHEELSRLIFHPGFSTRSSVNELSGRGVGMDVVAATLERLQGWVDVTSAPGQGTVVRIQIPRQSVIEHAMVFRVGQQQFAIATQFIRGTGIDDGAASGWESDDPAECLSSCDMRGLLGLRAEESTGDRPSILVQVSRDNRLRQPVYGAQQSSTCHVRLYVDEIIGPEEVVTRPLPYFLTGQRLFSGVTLAGSGNIMVLLDPNGLMESITERNETIVPEATSTDSGTVESKPRVLVVDDSFTTRRAIENILKRNGLETDLAADGKEALDRVKSEHYDMIFSDVEMPHMNGFEFLRQLRLLETDSHIPVVFVTSRGDKESQRTAEVLKAEGYIVKPVREESIMTAIQAQLSVTV